MKYSRIIYDCGKGSRNHTVTVELFTEEEGMTPAEYRKLRDIVSIDSVDTVVIRGHEPLDEPDLASLIKKIRKDFPEKKISVRTGYSIHEICTSSIANILALIDTLYYYKNNIVKVYTKKDFYCVRGF